MTTGYDTALNICHAWTVPDTSENGESTAYASKPRMASDGDSEKQYIDDRSDNQS